MVQQGRTERVKEFIWELVDSLGFLQRMKNYRVGNIYIFKNFVAYLFSRRLAIQIEKPLVHFWKSVIYFFLKAEEVRERAKD